MEGPSKLMAMMSSRRDTLILVSTRDILSSLPDQIVHHIFSFLGVNDMHVLVWHQKEQGTPISVLMSAKFCDRVKRLEEGYNVCMFTGLASKEDCVYECESLRVLKLNLQTGRLNFRIVGWGWLKDLWLDSVTVKDIYFGQRISDWCKSLKRLTLEDVDGISGGLIMKTSSLEEFTISGCNFGFTGGNLSSSSFKALTIHRCQFKAQRHVNLNCPLENLTVHDSEFRRCFLCTCVLNINSFSFQDLTLSECNLSSLGSSSQYFPPVKDLHAVRRPRRHIIVKAANLEKLNISSSDEYSCEFPLQPNLKVLWWARDPVDFSYLKQHMFMSLTSARIYIEPSCQHKSEESERHCKRSKSLIYCAANFLQCLSEVRFLRINTWPIEIFFMQNDSPITFKNLQNLVLLSDGSLADQIPFIAPFLEGMPGLKKLIISCFYKSHELSDPNLINLLGLNSRSFNVTEVSRDLKIARIEAVQAHQCMENAGRRRLKL
ncbi:hypothetical protein SADUNF_Sadunf06G0199900 [Salix dunnii]|uniref:Uncharacterized protein n=1 Tax=Salix dunnii TaxID=1413687 RepID=A0A835K5R9_9ROSI|nr:hypothetical protein SADUNF_Sadunf06G0199900 [Salix dunnii]